MVGLEEGSEIAGDGGEPSVVAARALLRDGGDLFDRGQYVQAIVAYDAVVDRFSGEAAGVLRERVAYALLRMGLCLGKLGRSEEAVVVYDDLIAGYGDDAEPAICVHVGWAFTNKANRLRELGRREQAIAAYDALLARFGAASEPGVRGRVSWALWNKIHLLIRLGRGEEAEAIYDELIARHDDGLDRELDQMIAWSIEHRARVLGSSGDLQRQVDLSAELVRRFGEARDLCLREHVLAALRLKAVGLAELGRREQELASYDEIVARFGEATETDFRDGVAESLRQKGITLHALGRGTEAIAAYDDALAVLAGTSEPQLGERAIAILLDRAVCLSNLDRAVEAVVMFDSAASVYRAARALGGGTPDALWGVVLGLVYKVETLCGLDRTEEAAEARDQLVAVLGDVATPAASDSALAVSGTGTEAELAAAFTQAFESGDCWRWFAADSEEPARGLMVDRALELYRLTEQWLTPGEDRPIAAQAAASWLRDIADGYAMLACSWSAADRDSLPLPRRAEDQRAELIRRFGIDEWAAELGHPLAPSEPAEAVGKAEAGEQPLEPASAEPVESARRFLPHFLSAAFNYELLAVLCDSPSGREVLKNEDFRLYSSREISHARKWTRWLWPCQEDGSEAALASVLIAEGWFIASWGTASSSASLFPSRSILRQLLGEDDTQKWLLDQEVQLPPWLTEDDDRRV